MERRNINHESDFKLLMTIGDKLIDIPFRFTFYSVRDPKTTYIAEWNGSETKNAIIVTPNNIVIPFDEHELPVGKLMVRKEFFKPDTQMLTDGELHYVSIEPVIDKSKYSDGAYIILGNKQTDDDDFEFNMELYTKLFAGSSAYELWLQQGNTGTMEDFLNSLTGKSAYQEWLDHGNDGTRKDFLDCLKGKDAYELWLEKDFLASEYGADAYKRWQNSGHSGSLDDFLNSSIGRDAFNDWKQNYATPFEEYMDALRGKDGRDAVYIVIADKFLDTDEGKSALEDWQKKTFENSEDGQDAYNEWLEKNSGTFEEFLNTEEGKSALEEWSKTGGSEDKFINSDEGRDAVDKWSEENPMSTEDLLNALHRDSVYDLWLKEGNEGSVKDFLDSLTGKSAYQEWLDQGNVGTPDDFFKAISGTGAYEDWINQGNEGTIEDFFDYLAKKYFESAEKNGVVTAEIVEELPEHPVNNKMYIVKTTDDKGDMYTEYLVVGGEYEMISQPTSLQVKEIARRLLNG